MEFSAEKYFLKAKDFLHEKFFAEEAPAVRLGLDIGTFSVKTVRLDSQKDKTTLVNYGISKIKNNNVTEAIREVLSTVNLDTKIANIGLSGQGAILRYVFLPKMPFKELKQSISTEADKYIPFPIEDVILDFHILKESTQENKMLVLIAAVKKEIVQERIKLLTSLSLEFDVIDINSVAMVNSFNELRSKVSSLNPDEAGEDKPKATAILNIGASISFLNILEGNLPKFSRDIYVGGNNFSKKIAYARNVDLESAEQMKCNPTDEQWSKNLEACELLLNNLTHELRLSFDYYETENNTPIKKLYLSGGSAYLKGIRDLLNKNLGIETEVWDPTPYLEIKPELDVNNFKSQSSALAVALGLALR